MSKVPPPKGTRDFYPEEMAIHNWICDRWKAISQRNGFVEYDGPIFEYLQLYTQKSGDEIASQLFSLTDRGGRELAIRPEMTPTLARMVNQKINALPKPIKWFSIPRLCRAERPQKGRLREFYQWNIDIIGSDHLLADAESIFTAVDYLRSVGLLSSDIEVKLSSRSMIAAVLIDIGFDANNLDPVYVLLDKRAKVSIDAFTEMVAEVVTDKTLAKKLMQLQGVTTLDEVAQIATSEDAKNAITALRQLFNYLTEMGIGDYVVFDIKIVRGLDYYTGPVFEWVTDRLGAQNAICAGGRYDGLFAELGGREVPAAGFACGMERLLELVVQGGLGFKMEMADVWLVLLGTDAESAGFTLAESLRDRGLRAICNCGGGSISQQLRRADRSEARFAAVIGEEELRDSQVTIKPLRDGSSQVRMAREDVAEYLLSNRVA